jgi:hypothetical protein
VSPVFLSQSGMIKPKTMMTDIFTVPLGCALVFGTQPSILRVWAFWRPRKPRSEKDSYATSFALIADGRGKVGKTTKFNFDPFVDPTSEPKQISSDPIEGSSNKAEYV